MIQKITTFFDEYNRHGDYDIAITKLERELKKFSIEVEYKSTDAWRGYYQAISKSPFWKPLDDERLHGWCTGEWDDAPEGTKGSEVNSVLDEYKDKQVIIVYLPTSNVFSTAYDVFIHQ